MHQLDRYRFECCGRRLSGKYRFCPECGEKANRREPTEAEEILREIDKRATGFESNARNQKGKAAQYAAEATEAPACVGRADWEEYEKFHYRNGQYPSCTKCRATQQKELAENSAAGFARRALWYRRVEKLILSLLSTT